MFCPILFLFVLIPKIINLVDLHFGQRTSSTDMVALKRDYAKANGVVKILGCCYFDRLFIHRHHNHYHIQIAYHG